MRREERSDPEAGLRSLEEQLASVIEGDGVLYAGDGMKLLAKPSMIEVTRPKRRRRNSRRSTERARQFTGDRAEAQTGGRAVEEEADPVLAAAIEAVERSSGQAVEAAVADPVLEAAIDAVERTNGETIERVPIRAESAEREFEINRDAFRVVARPVEVVTETPPDDASDAFRLPALQSLDVILERRVFPIRAIPVRYAEHARSPFVVSLRGLTLGVERLKADEAAAQRDVLGYDLRADDVPNLTVLEALAADLVVDEADGVRYSEQFTKTTFASSYAGAYGPVTKVLDRVGAWIDRLWDSVRSSGRAVQRSSRKSARQPDRSSARPQVRVSTIPVPVSRTVVLMGALAFVAMLPANAVRLARTLEDKKSTVSIAGTDAMNDLKNAAGSDLSQSVDALRRASDRFRAADESLANTNALALTLANLIPEARTGIASARALLEVGSKASEAARLLAKGFDAALQGTEKGPLHRLGILSAYTEGALPLLDDASRTLVNVDRGVLPEVERAKIDLLRDGLETGRLAVREFVGASELLQRLLGRDAPKRFLIVFQNPNELRPTGGFMGSYAELDVDQGEIERLVIPGGGTYDLQGQLVRQIIPPEPLRLVANRWEFQDANWSPDFPTSAAKMRDLWSASGGYTVDGVIAVNASVIADLLEITGPIDVPELGKTLTAENAIQEIQLSTEIEYDRAENKPKKILSLAGPRLVEKLKSLPPDGLLRAITVLSDALIRKEIQVALTSAEEDALAQGFDWSGRMKRTSGDALAVIGANIAGGKTDAVIRERIAHEAEIAENGTITDRLTITRLHDGIKRAPLTGVRNVSYVRVYVPLGSTLLSAAGFATSPRALIEEPREDAVPDPDVAAIERTRTAFPGSIDVWDEGDRTVFGGWSTVDPGQAAELQLTYRLPYSAFDIRARLTPSNSGSNGARAAYSVLYTSQSGAAKRTLTSTVRAPASWTSAWSRDFGSAPSVPWDRDRVRSTLFDTPTP